MEFTGKKVLVVGSGISGIAACELLIEEKAQVILFDGNEAADIAAIRAKSPALTEVEIILGALPEGVRKSLDMAVLSPGVPTDIPMVNAIREDGTLIIGEIELAYQLSKGKIVAITGTNGKTTTTALVGEIMEAYYQDVKVVGNIGIPYTSVARETNDETVTVAEISSFQLETTVEFAPEVTAILNITPDHLNRHHTMECYAQVKMSITKNQKENQTCVLNYEDEVLRKFGETLQCNVVFFSSKRKLTSGYYLDGTKIMYAHEGQEEAVVDVEELNILGNHNYENAMAATAMAYSFGVPMDVIRRALRHFQAVEHRIEYVTEKRGVRFYNDSKGTNVDAAIQGIKAMNRKTCLIGGGYDKGSEYDEWIEAFDGKVKKLVLLGVTADKIAETARRHGFTDIVMASSMEEAVQICYDNAVSGDAVLLSPACASWGMFDNYEQRGRIFKELVHNLKE